MTSKEKNRICINCGIEFSKKTSKKGKFTECDECSETDQTIRAVGFNDGTLNKAQHISIYKGGDEKTIKQITGHRMV